jgi:ParB-like chromosome segregation protein Spo0J
MAVTLEDRVAKLQQLFLDPNNPRFSDLGVRPRVSEDKVHEEQHQAQTLGTLLNDDRFEVGELKESIRQIGFLKMDRMVVIELVQNEAFMVIEGNRRLAALKSMQLDHAAGEIDLPPNILESVLTIPVLVIQGPAKERIDFARTLQGIRHISGIKPWGPYQQAQAVGQMLQESMMLAQIRSVLGLSVQRVNLLRRVFLSMEQMKGDPDFSSFARPALFSDFVEALKLPKLREWLEWDEEEGTFKNEGRRRQFYSWLVGMEDDEGQRRDPKVVDAKDLRDLPLVMEDGEAFNKFLTDPDLKLRAAIDLIPRPSPQIDWRRDLRVCTHALRSVPHSEISSATDSDVSLLQQLRAAADQLLSDIDVLRGAAAAS